MPEVRPFRAWRFDSAVAGSLDHLICPPYDVISPEQARALLEGYPRNAIHLELGPGSTDPAAPDSRYRRAGATLDRWIAEGALRRDVRPCLYVYEQCFTLEGQPRRRVAFFAAVRLSPWAEGRVLPHEVTHAAPKADRLALLQATRANISPIYALCDAGLPGVAALLEVVERQPPQAVARDDAGERHRLWAVDDAALIAAVQRDLAQRPLFIADGHHRYETALAYAQTQPARSEDGAEGAGYVLMGVTPVDDPGLVVLPTHRLLRDLDGDQLAHGLARLDDAFVLQELDPRAPAEALLETLAGTTEDHAFLLVLAERTVLLRPRRDATGAGDGLHPAVRRLDVSLLHALFFEGLLGLTDDDLESQRYVDYTRDAGEALRLARDGSYQLAVLLNGTPAGAILDVARAGATMPQKSTYFYPKLATGLVLRRLEP